MKNYILLLLITLLSYTSQSKPVNEVFFENEIPAITECNEANNIPTQKKYVATKKNIKDDFNQNLSVSWISETVVQYTFVFDNQSCKKTIGGTAKISIAKKKPSFSSHEGNTFEINRYEDHKNGFKIVLQIDALTKDKAIVEMVFTEDPEEEDCKPHSVVMIAQN